MGVVSSRLDDGSPVYLRDQNRLSISSLVITSPRKRSSTTITPNSFPATRASVARTPSDVGPVEFVLDPESLSVPSFLLKVNNDDELIFNFTFIIRQEEANADTQINGLTYVYASTTRDLANLVTREFHADPNLHKNSNVELVDTNTGGNYSTGGNPSVSFSWSWRWKPPRRVEDRGGGWKNVCSFLEYDARAHQLNPLATFSFWVASTPSPGSQPPTPSPFQLAVPPKIRVPSAQSLDSRLSEQDEPISPPNYPFESPGAAPVPPQPRRDSVKLDIACPRPGEDMVGDDGPVFRAMLKALEHKTGNIKTHMKKVCKMADKAHAAQTEANIAYVGFIDALRDATTSNANAVQPAIEHYFDKIAREILAYERQNTVNLQKNVIEPMNKLYSYEIKQAESKKRDFEEDSKEYYNFVSRYLGQKQDSGKTKKLAESDTKYQTKRKNFELKRFDYSSFIQDLSGGRKEQEVLSHLTNYADNQTEIFLSTAKKIESMMPHLKALTSEVEGANKEYQYQKLEREEKRRVLEKSNLQYNEPENAITGMNPLTSVTTNGAQHIPDSELGRADSTGSQLKPTSTGNSSFVMPTTAVADLSRSPGSHAHPSLNSPSQGSKFKGIRDLEDRDVSQMVTSEKNSTQRKEGLLWALSRPGTHVDPLSLNKQGWHKWWVVLDGGKLSEYDNWKQRLDLHMEPIDLRMASVREARNAERRFCFEVITPHFKRVYQATSGEDMNSWISSINNALQSAMEGHGLKEKLASSSETGTLRRDIGSVLTGKSSSLNHGSHYGSGSSAPPSRRTTVGARPLAARPTSSNYDDSPDRLLQTIRDTDKGNCWCADCGSGLRVEWVSINLGIILCIECSGIHRSLGTHISKVRSLTLDITSFTLDIIELLLLVGNRVSNMVWEARLDPGLKLDAQATREQRLRFITAKYVERAYVEPISATLSRYATADETLLAAIKRNEIQQVIQALALKANPNVPDKVRDTHPIFLALAAADPAPPSPGMTPTTRPETESRTTPFAMAEMLIQNGAEIPSTMPAFPLSRNARLYVDEKRGRNAAIEASGLVVPINHGSLHGDRSQRDRDTRLQKRISAGGRLAKSPIPER
ncbi:ArfGap-domain-containing protein [Astrocystis sublimbata]|nr:ArfGap-domain-containing protein [Astrocystis sublimbata]